MVIGFFSLYLAFVIAISLAIGLLVMKLRFPSPRLIMTLLILFVVLPLLIGYLYLIYFNSLPEVTVPNVAGLSEAAAKEALEAVNLQAREGGSVYDPKLPEGFVVSQRPEAGRNVKVGRVVNLMINAGGPKVPAPNLIGKPLSQAGGQLQAAELQQGDVRFERHPEMAEGTIIAQEPLPGEETLMGARVDLLVSTTAEVITQESSRGGE